MTNLMLWLMYGAIFTIPYSAIVLNSEAAFLAKWWFEIKILPLVMIIFFGIYSAVVVLYRTLTINDCPEAERELREQIKQAKEDIAQKLHQLYEYKT